MKQQANKNLQLFADVVEELGIVYWLEGGTLLGAYRDKDFCQDDENDIDLSTWANYQYLIPNIIQKAEKKGFVLHKHYKDYKTPDFAQQLAFKKDGLKIDFIFYEKIHANAVAGVYKQHKQGFERIPRVVPVQYFELLHTIEFYNREYNRPYDVEGYLTYCYGDWKTPIHRSKYSCYNPNQLKALQPDFII